LPTIGQYRIKHPTIALFHEDGRHIARTVPAGALITVDSAAFDGNRLVDVTWDEKKVMMFAQHVPTVLDAAKRQAAAQIKVGVSRLEFGQFAVTVIDRMKQFWPLLHIAFMDTRY
jgi:hypothetical protein